MDLREGLDKWQLKYLEKAEILQAELIANGFMASRIVKGEDRCDFSVIYFDGNRDYKIARDYHGNVYVTRLEYTRYDNVSGSTRGEIWKKYRGNNVKVITAKKLQGKIDAENAYHDEMDSLNLAASNKQDDFVQKVKAIEAQGVLVRWNKDADSDKIKGGYIERGGLEFSFELSSDGYVAQIIRVSYSPDNTLENFMKLSDNAYKV